jgi:mRNA-degrading endonuclease RelE of RelBE toxin-antitoxin system
MLIVPSARFKKTYKKLPSQWQKIVEHAIDDILGAPHLGELKKGDLAGLYVYKFRMNNQLTLLGYCLKENETILELVDVGPHENFYRDLK